MGGASHAAVESRSDNCDHERLSFCAAGIAPITTGWLLVLRPHLRVGESLGNEVEREIGGHVVNTAKLVVIERDTLNNTSWLLDDADSHPQRSCNLFARIVVSRILPGVSKLAKSIGDRRATLATWARSSVVTRFARVQSTL